MSTYEEVTEALIGPEAEILDLQEAMAGDEPDFASEPHEPSDDAQADRWLLRLRLLEDEDRRVSLLAEEQFERIQAWKERRQEVNRNAGDWYRQGLELFHRGRLSRDPRAKTISFPNGTLKSRAQQPEWNFDEETFVQWAKRTAPELYTAEWVEKPNKVAAKKILQVKDGKAIDIGGEVVPGVTVTERERSFSVEV